MTTGYGEILGAIVRCCYFLHLEKVVEMAEKASQVEMCWRKNFFGCLAIQSSASCMIDSHVPPNTYMA